MRPSAVCTQEDGFTREKWLAEARWVAELSDGTRVIQDDDRPGADPPSAWLRLKDHVGRTGLRVVGLTASFRGENRLELPRDAAGYFFLKAAGAWQGDGVTLHYFLLGHLQDGKLTVQRWRVPEFVKEAESDRDPNDPFLLRNSESDRERPPVPGNLPS